MKLSSVWDSDLERQTWKYSVRSHLPLLNFSSVSVSLLFCFSCSSFWPELVATTDSILINSVSYWPSYCGPLPSFAFFITYMLPVFSLIILSSWNSYRFTLCAGGVEGYCMLVQVCVSTHLDIRGQLSGIISQKLLTLSWDRISHWDLGLTN